jgi:hypothetical protein
MNKYYDENQLLCFSDCGVMKFDGVKFDLYVSNGQPYTLAANGYDGGPDSVPWPCPGPPANFTPCPVPVPVVLPLPTGPFPVTLFLPPADSNCFFPLPYCSGLSDVHNCLDQHSASSILPRTLTSPYSNTPPGVT